MLGVTQAQVEALGLEVVSELAHELWPVLAAKVQLTVAGEMTSEPESWQETSLVLVHRSLQLTGQVSQLHQPYTRRCEYLGCGVCKGMQLPLGS